MGFNLPDGCRSIDVDMAAPGYWDPPDEDDAEDSHCDIHRNGFLTVETHLCPGPSAESACTAWQDNPMIDDECPF
jgi:hypothetical protein